MDDIIATPSDFVIDNGATKYLPFMAYLVENRVADVLTEHGRELVIHVPIVGAEAKMETLQGFDDIASNIGENAKIVIWLIEAIKGVILFDGKEFEATKAYEAHRANINAIIRVPHHTSELFARDMDELLSNRGVAFGNSLTVEIWACPARCESTLALWKDTGGRPWRALRVVSMGWRIRGPAMRDGTIFWRCWSSRCARC